MSVYDVPGRPRRGWVGVVGFATRTIPSGPVRDRYRQELVAEMYGMDTTAQRRHALSVLAHAGSLRAAVLDPETTKEETMRKPVRCLLGMHKDKMVSADDGSRYLRCVRCRRDHQGNSSGAIPGAGGTFM